jgi:hypothetical protein
MGPRVREDDGAEVSGYKNDRDGSTPQIQNHQTKKSAPCGAPQLSRFRLFGSANGIL